MSVLDDEAGVKTQFVLWGYAVTGDICERQAVIAEDRNVEAIVPGAWDHDRAWLERQLVSHGSERYRRPRDWSALPQVAEHCMRGHEPWPGL